MNGGSLNLECVTNLKEQDRVPQCDRSVPNHDNYPVSSQTPGEPKTGKKGRLGEDLEGKGLALFHAIPDQLEIRHGQLSPSQGGLIRMLVQLLPSGPEPFPCLAKILSSGPVQSGHVASLHMST